MSGGAEGSKEGGFGATQAVEEKHAHLLTKTNIQMCTDCHRFFVITYEKNEKGEAVETGYELDLHVASSGIVRPRTGDWDPQQKSENYLRRRAEDRKEFSCF